MYPVTPVGRLFASIISLVGIGIIAIPTGIIAAGFNQAISKEHNEEAAEEPPVKEMSEEELLLMQARISNKLKQYGYKTVISNDQEMPEGDP